MSQSERTDSSVRDIRAIDVHGHYGIFSQRHHPPQKNRFMTATAETVAKLARQANTEWTIVSPLKGLMPRCEADAIAGNEEARSIVPQTDGLLQWVIVNPLQPETYGQAGRMLQDAWCAGIKIHPEEHGYPINLHGRAIFEFAAKHRAVVLTHSGEKNSLPGEIVPFANDYPEIRLILAHLGCGWDGDPSYQVRAIQASKRGNVFVDTSSAQSILPNIVEWAVGEIGAERLLYGTDTPLYFTPMQRARIDHADICDEDKRLILRENAVRILGSTKIRQIGDLGCSLK